MRPRARLGTAVHGLARTAAVAAAIGFVAAAYAPPSPHDPQLAPPAQLVTPIQATPKDPCEEVAGKIRDCIGTQLMSAIPNPFAAVYDADSAHHPTGGKFIVTSCEPGNANLYIIGPHGESPQYWTSPLTSDGRGIAIGGKEVLGQDYIWGAAANGEIIKVDFDANYDCPMGTEAVCMTGIAWDKRSNSLIVYDFGDPYNSSLPKPPRLLQYDVVTGEKRSEVSLAAYFPDGDGYCSFGVACDGCDGNFYIPSFGSKKCLRLTPQYINSGTKLNGFQQAKTLFWDDAGFPTITGVLGISYDADGTKLAFIDSDIGSRLFTADDGCCWLLAD
jgi:hypothetical protein